MMTRLLLLGLVVVGLVLWWKHSQRGRVKRERPPEEAAPDAPKKNPETMLRCVECGLHLPASQALPGKGGSFCSAAHRQAFEARGGS